MIPRKQLLFCTLLILGLAACNLPTSQKDNAPAQVNNAPADVNDAPAQVNNAAATITALAATIQAQNISATGPAFTSTATSPAPTDTATNTPQPTSTATITLTPTLSVPMVTVSQATNCRTGPGTQYDQVGALNVGQSAQIVGKYTAGNYWIIKNPNSTGTCWLWGQYATTSGDIGGLPEMTPPATPTPTFTPTPSVPAGAKHFGAVVTCTSGGLLLYNVHVVLSWQDMATNEDGYYAFRNGALIATLPANTTSLADDTTLPKFVPAGHPMPSMEYKLQAFNGAGNSDMRALTAACP